MPRPPARGAESYLGQNIRAGGLREPNQNQNQAPEINGQEALPGTSWSQEPQQRARFQTSGGCECSTSRAQEPPGASSSSRTPQQEWQECGGIIRSQSFRKNSSQINPAETDGGGTQTSPQASAGGASVEESAELQHRKICFSSEEEMAPLLCVHQSPEVRGISSRVESWAAAHARASREAESLQRFPQTKAEEVWSRAAPACTRLAGAALVPTAPQQRRIQPSQRPFTHLLPRLLLLWF